MRDHMLARVLFREGRCLRIGAADDFLKFLDVHIRIPKKATALRFWFILCVCGDASASGEN